MQVNVKNLNVNVEFYDNKAKDSLVFLHGWGQNIEMMNPVAKPFIKSHNVLVVDLPGFGYSDEPSEEYDIYDYVEVVHELCNHFKIKNPILIGHSFGGKISLAYGIKYEPKKLVLLASPYAKKIKKPTLKMRIFKIVKKIPGLTWLEKIVKKHVGSTDYRNASDTMRKILVRHVNLDLTDDLSKVKCPTLLIWGTNDTQVDYEDAVKLEQLINNCGLVTYEGCTHYAYLERLNQTINVLKSFIGSEEK